MARAPRRPSPPTQRPTIGRMIAALEKAHPDARLALDWTSPLQLLVALILAAQCTDAKVNEVTPLLFGRYRTAKQLAGAGQEEIEELIRPTGFYRQKARAVHACCQKLVDQFGGEVPRDLESLLTLPGV